MISRETLTLFSLLSGFQAYKHSFSFKQSAIQQPESSATDVPMFENVVLEISLHVTMSALCTRSLPLYRPYELAPDRQCEDESANIVRQIVRTIKICFSKKQRFTTAYLLLLPCHRLF
ncbi:uncharacterized protein LY89DRAFT_491042 [Mollisia scopiformis]|uniref:Uncharacterized protein n=1 Tax=Mollisia scopiformis TaxID=149040 RepID=A0A194XH55_MOLSC|nr:uncharacterized protein LY89DRAFT_491042 [Mollisia scopiformis]KUJ19459.1 hypothetical protein LY89DRAFT_491042 [Mollisia scopiformis]